METSIVKFGKYYKEIKAEYRKILKSSIIEENLVKENKIEIIYNEFQRIKIHAFRNFDFDIEKLCMAIEKNEIKKIKELLENNSKFILSKKELEISINRILTTLLFFIQERFKLSKNKILLIGYKIHRQKNYIYNDGWYHMGKLGVIYDANRKVERLVSLDDTTKFKSIDSLFDTCIDLVNYCVLFLVALNFNE
ncbi:MAG: hypothetical protein ACRDDH_12070 [Cetobacterium sp.]|uniref:hypothetical protein n=1 Tax=Cetobacterium sp. TaxID=2071632 RepID=UPI003EE749B1